MPRLDIAGPYDIILDALFREAKRRKIPIGRILEELNKVGIELRPPKPYLAQLLFGEAGDIRLEADPFRQYIGLRGSFRW